jgi:hypothetical protein
MLCFQIRVHPRKSAAVLPLDPCRSVPICGFLFLLIRVYPRESAANFLVGLLARLRIAVLPFAHVPGWRNGRRYGLKIRCP